MTGTSNEATLTDPVDPTPITHTAEAADVLNPVAHVPAEPGETPTAPAVAMVDVTAKLDAGTALFYAIYHSGTDFVLSMPKPVMDAYARACHAFDPKGYRR